MNPYIESYLKPFIGRIVVVNQFDRWKQKREDYLYNGDFGNKRLRNILPNEVILEFDFTEKGNDQFIKAKIEEKCAKYVIVFNVSDGLKTYEGTTINL